MASREAELNSIVYDNALANVQNAQKPTYAGTYENQLNDIYNRIENREKFNYNVNADPLYQNYKDQYVQGGKLAMKDTMGQAAALTGGYGSTYGQQVGQQAYNQYLQNLSAAIPELYGMAYSQYKDEGDRLQDLYGMVGQRRDTEYGQYRDQLGDWERGQQMAADLEKESYNRRMSEEETTYNRQQDSLANLMALIQASGYEPTDEELAAAGMTREAANALKAEYNRQAALQAAGRSSGGGGGGGARSGASTQYANSYPANYNAYLAGIDLGNNIGWGVQGMGGNDSAPARFATALNSGALDNFSVQERNSMYQGIVDSMHLAYLDK